MNSLPGEEDIGLHGPWILLASHQSSGSQVSQPYFRFFSAPEFSNWVLATGETAIPFTVFRGWRGRKGPTDKSFLSLPPAVPGHCIRCRGHHHGLLLLLSGGQEFQYHGVFQEYGSSAWIGMGGSYVAIIIKFPGILYRAMSEPSEAGYERFA